MSADITIVHMSKWSADVSSQCKCDDCQWQGPMVQLGKQLDETPDLNQRLSPGSVVPAGECPKCGAFAYLTGDQFHSGDCQ